MKKFMPISTTIGVCAHNEEKNIRALLDSITAQSGRAFLLKEILVILDGCSDRTEEFAQKAARRNQKITIINDSRHLGKMERLNQLYKRAAGEVFICFDADIILGHKHVIENLVLPFQDKNVGLTGAFCRPVLPKSFTGLMVYKGIKIWEETRIRIGDGNVIHNHHAQASAVHASLYKSSHLPVDIMAEDDFWYFSSLKKRKRFVFVPLAPVYYGVPETLSDFFRQSSRFLGAKRRIREYFGSGVDTYYQVPVSTKLKGLLAAFINDPLWMPIASLFQILARIFTVYFHDEPGRFWTPIRSSKFSLGEKL